MWPTIDAVGQAQRQRALGLPNLGPTTNLYNVFAGQIRASYTFDLFGVERFANSARNGNPGTAVGAVGSR